MRFWDSSAILPLLVREDNSAATRTVLDEDFEMVFWWATSVECRSALARLEREGVLNLAGMKDATGNLSGIISNGVCVEASEPVRKEAMRLLRRYPLRAADSLQLAAALIFVDRDAEEFGFVCNDHRLSEAAAKEGFDVLVP